MSGLQITRLVSHLDEIAQSRRAWAAAVIAIDGLGSELEPLIALGERLGDLLGRRSVALLGDSPAKAYGKSAIVGTALEIEYGAAILHPRLGKPLRQLVGGGKALIPSTIKKGGPGCAIDVPLHGKDDEWDFALLDSIEASVSGAPAESEIIVILALAAGGRVHARVGASPTNSQSSTV
jgi:hypothetical protein